MDTNDFVNAKGPQDVIIFESVFQLLIKIVIFLAIKINKFEISFKSIRFSRKINLNFSLNTNLAEKS